ncbi:MAG: bifunctional methylenetetrahydrofolate dehydrogenase/methenyltetrahydrofolate cyclohydrolase FolD [Bacteroidota bacterium]
MKIIDGKLVSEQLKTEIALEVKAMIDKGISPPHLAAILVGDDGASQTYVANKEKSSHEVGFISTTYRFPETISEKELLDSIDFINNDDEIDGLIVQLPLPKHISADKVIHRIDPTKDVDGFHPQNLGKLVLGEATYIPATPYGILQLLQRSGIETVGKQAVVIGRSNIVGTPMTILLSRNANPGNCTVTICHSKTKNLAELARTADILIVAIGRPEMITAEFVKPGATVIDVGIHRIEDASRKSGFRLVGDVKFDEVSQIAGAITPVPGGVGPMTIVGLLQNTLIAKKNKL